MALTGAQLLVKALAAEQVDTVFAYPGGQAIDLFDALYDAQGLEMIVPRHEQGLIHAADGYARSTGRVGVCLVTSGPGAANLVTGIATANYDSVPLVCFTGQVPLSLLGKETFQEIDIVSVTQTITKYAVMVRRLSLIHIYKGCCAAPLTWRDHQLGWDAFFELAHVGNDADQSTAQLQFDQRIHRRIQRIAIPVSYTHLIS